MSDHKVEVVSASSIQAKHLHVEVKENGEYLVQLEMPARAVDNLQDLVPPAVMASAKSGVDLRAIVARVRKNGYQPEILFEAETDNRSYKVWLA